MATKITATDAIKGTLAETQGVQNILSSNGITLESSLREIVPPLLEDPFVLNSFLTKIYNKIIRTKIIDGRFENPLGRLKKGDVGGYGDMIEQIVNNPAEGVAYGTASHNILTDNPPDAKVEYIKVNRKDEYDVTLTYPQVMQAFTSESGFSAFKDATVNTLINGDGIDEFKLMKKIVSDMFSASVINKVVSESNPADFTKQLINYAKIFQFPDTEYVPYNKMLPDGDRPLEMWCKPESIVILIRTDKMTNVSVDVLSAAFNLDKIQLTANIIEVDKFTNNDGEDLGIDAVIMDETFMQVYDTLYQFANFERADNLSLKSYLHHWQIVNCSLFAKSVVLYHE